MPRLLQIYSIIHIFAEFKNSAKCSPVAKGELKTDFNELSFYVFFRLKHVTKHTFSLYCPNPK